MSNVLSAEDIEFLTNLANELRTQDVGCQRKPVFIQVREPVKQWGIDTEYAEETAIFIGDSARENPLYTVEEAKEYLAEYRDIEVDDDSLVGLTCFDDIERFCEEEEIDCFIGGFNKGHKFHQAFLTFSAFQEHMRQNKHNYAHGTGSWLDSFFRNPQMERLLNIVEKFATINEKE